MYSQKKYLTYYVTYFELQIPNLKSVFITLHQKTLIIQKKKLIRY